MGKRNWSKTSTEAGSSSSKKSEKSKKDKRKNWSPDLDKRFKIMQGAVEDVIEKKMSIRKAAEKWGVKRSTLADRVTGRVGLGSRSGPPSILTRAEEQMLAEWIISMAQRGFGFKKHKLLKTVKKILDKDKRTTMLKKNMPGNKWYRQFVKRNPRVKMVTSNPHLEMGRLDKTAKPSIEYEALNSMLPTCKSESGSECDSDSDSNSELDSESGSEAELELQPQSPILNTIQALDSELEPDQKPENLDLELEPDQEPENLDSELEPDQKPENLDSELEPDQEPENLDSELKPDQEPENLDSELEPDQEPENLDSELEPDQEPENLDSEPDALTIEDFQVDQSSDPSMAVGITVTISTSE